MTHDLEPQNVFMDRFILEEKTQRVWGIPHATWFTLMGVGGGLYLLGRLLGLTARLGLLLGIPLVDVISFAAIAIGGLILIADLGRPFRFWRAFLNVRTSWISWGAICDAIFLLFGGLLVLPSLELGGAHPFAGLPWNAAANSPAGHVFEVIAGLAAVVVMFYAGAVLAKPRAIPYWHSPAIPLQFLLSATALSMAIILALEVGNDEPVSVGQLALLALSLGLLLVAIAWHVLTRRDVPGKSHSLERLLRGRYRGQFVGGVVGIGTALPLALALLGLAMDEARDAVAVASLVILAPAAFLLRLITLRVGIFPPVKELPMSVGA